MIAILCVAPNSHYRRLAGVDVWDAERDARRYAGPWPVVAHPPCGPWGKLRGQCKGSGKDVGPVCVEHVRRYGGVLEHPAFSLLWAECGMPRPGLFADEFGGRSYEVQLSSFGSPVRKRTWLYCVRTEVPGVLEWKRATRTVDQLWSDERQLTPLAMCRFLCDLASSVRDHDLECV